METLFEHCMIHDKKMGLSDFSDDLKRSVFVGKQLDLGDELNVSLSNNQCTYSGWKFNSR